MRKEAKKVNIKFVQGKPMDLAEIPGAVEMGELTEDQKDLIGTVGPTIAAYIKAAQELLSGKLAYLKSLAPPHLADPGNVLIVGCSDGVVIRYETKSDKHSNVVWGSTEDSLPEITSALSEDLIRIRHDQTDPLDVEASGIDLKIIKGNASTGESTEIFTAGVIFDVMLTTPPVAPSPASKPFCLLSVRSSMELHLAGEILPAEPNRGPSRPFLARSLLRLPVGWDCIEVFHQPPPAIGNQNSLGPGRKTISSERPISHQFREAQLNSLDPNAAARRHFATLFEEYKKLLDSNPEREEILQEFLTAHPALLCPSQIGMWPKLALGAHVTDFVFREVTGDYILVELEKSTDPLFIKSGHSSSKLNHARGQLQDWRRYLEDNLSTVQRELGLLGITPSPRCLIVIGRAGSLSPENRRKLAVIENESPRLKILTYDDVLENAKAVVENLLGPLWNVHGATHIYFPPTGAPMDTGLRGGIGLGSGF